MSAIQAGLTTRKFMGRDFGEDLNRLNSGTSGHQSRPVAEFDDAEVGIEPQIISLSKITDIC